MNTLWSDFLAQNPASKENSPHVSVSLTPVPHLSVIRVSGQDAGQFLQGQLTCDIGKLTGSNSFFAAFCNAKGKTISTLLVLKIEDSFLLVTPDELVDTVLAQLSRYILRAKVNLAQDRTYCLLGLTCLKNITRLTPDVDFAVELNSVFSLKMPSHQYDRYLVIGTPDCLISFWQQQVEKFKAKIMPSNNWDYQDISSGLPWLTQKTSERYIPQMLNIDKLGGISFDKGCYTGQEVIARTHYLGKVKRKLLLFESDHCLEIEVNTPVLQADTLEETGYVLSSRDNGQTTRLLVVGLLTHSEPTFIRYAVKLRPSGQRYQVRLLG